MKINLIQIVLTGGIALSSLVGFTTTNHGGPTSVVDQWFDSYGDVSRADEKAHKDNLLVNLFTACATGLVAGLVT
jgi:hypothetical protein